MKLVVRQRVSEPATDDAVERLTSQYKAAYAIYRHLVDENAKLCLNGDQPSDQALHDEEQAFEALDCARHALLGAAQQAYPTIH